MAKKKLPTYSPTKVTRYVMRGGVEEEKIAEYEDAIVRDQGGNNWLRVPDAMLRAYSNDPKVWGEWDKHDEWFVVDDETVDYYGEKRRGYVLDCDGDIALKRILGIVLSKFSFGHGNEEWVVLVDWDEDDKEWNGWGDHEQFRIEKWRVKIRDDKS